MGAAAFATFTSGIGALYCWETAVVVAVGVHWESALGTHLSCDNSFAVNKLSLLSNDVKGSAIDDQI